MKRLEFAVNTVLLIAIALLVFPFLAYQYYMTVKETHTDQKFDWP